MNRIDELFKNKLANHPVAPSADAWQKIEAGLAKKNSVWVWRMAAALVLFGLAGAWYVWRTTEVPPALVQQPVPVPDQKVAEQLQPAGQKQNLAVETKVEKKRKRNTTKSVAPIETKAEKTEQITATEPEGVVQPEIVIAENKTEPAVTRKPIVIEFTLEAIPAPTAESAVAIADAADDKSGLQKILEKARDIKSGESELGSLRDAKNELFALDFRKDKTKRN